MDLSTLMSLSAAADAAKAKADEAAKEIGRAQRRAATHAAAAADAAAAFQAAKTEMEGVLATAAKAAPGTRGSQKAPADRVF